jgi:hypothetical protein
MQPMASKWAALALMFAAASPLGAQAPEGWSWRLDGADRAPKSGEVQPGEWAWQTMPPGWHLTTTDQGATLFPSTPRPMTGRWGVEMEFFLFPNPSAEGVGVALEATTTDMQGARMFLLLRRDGQVSVHVNHNGTEEVMMPWSADTAAPAHNGSETKRYVMRVNHEPGRITFAVDGRLRATIPTEGAEYAPVAGIRVGKGLNLHISRFDLVTPMAPARP